MHIWVDADACPKTIREILCRAAERTGTPVTFVANQLLALPRSPLIRGLQVPSGFDAADHEIVRRAQAEDLVVTSDIPLAADALGKGCAVISPRGERYSTATIGALLTMRDFMDTLRAGGVQTGGPPAFGQADRQAFANQLDRWLAQSKARGASEPPPG